MVNNYLNRLTDLLAAEGASACGASNPLCDGTAPSPLPLYHKAYHIAQEITLGQRAQSNLADYGYDMVYSFTLGSINATMKQYIMRMGNDTSPEIRYYVYRLDPVTQRAIVTEADAETAAELERLDLFHVPDDPALRTPEQNAAVAQAWSVHKAAYAFRATMGVPEGIKPAQLDNILDFDAGETGNHAKVRYLLYFKEFSIIQWNFNPFTQTPDFSNLRQGTDLWAFSFRVDLGLVGVDDDRIPPEIREKIHNIDPGSMFSIQQLFLDLNTTALQDFPVITGVSEEAMETLSSKFVNVYFKRLRELGDVIFAYSVKPSSPGHKPYILTPTDFRFFISPYYENGEASGKKNLYTLNYIVSCGGKMPSLREFTWNWVDEWQYAKVNGAMAINRDRILDFAVNEYKTLTDRLLFVPSATMTIDDPISIEIFFSMGKDRETHSSFEENTFHYEKTASDSDTFVPLWGNITIKYTLDALVRSYQSENGEAMLECRIDTVAWLHVNVEGGISEGNILNETSWYTLKTSVDAYGGLKFTPTVRLKDNGSNFEVSTWSSLITDDFDGLINPIIDLINGYINRNHDFAQGAFIKKYNGNALWVLPGDQSLIFKDPMFSDGADLTFDTNYAKITEIEPAEGDRR